jgi:hypothetical protein
MKTYNIDSGSKIRSRPPKNNNKTRNLPDHQSAGSNWTPKQNLSAFRTQFKLWKKKILGICSAFPETIYMSYKCITWWMRLRRRSCFFQCSCTHTWTSWADSSLLELVTTSYDCHAVQLMRLRNKGHVATVVQFPTGFLLGTWRQYFQCNWQFCTPPHPKLQKKGK